MFRPVHLNEALQYYKTIGDTEASFKPKASDIQTFRPSFSKHIKVDQVNVDNPKNQKRCKKCGSFGHTYQNRANTEDVCHNCGNPGHMRKTCHIKVLKLVNNDIAQSDDEEDSHLIHHNQAHNNVVASARQASAPLMMTLAWFMPRLSM